MGKYPNCHAVNDRDINTAKNIRKRDILKYEYDGNFRNSILWRSCKACP